MSIADTEWFETNKIHSTSYLADIHSWCGKVMMGSNKDEAALFFASHSATVTIGELRSVRDSTFPSERLQSKVQSLSFIQSAQTHINQATVLILCALSRPKDRSNRPCCGPQETIMSLQNRYQERFSRCA